MRKKLLALGVAVMMVMALSGVVLAEELTTTVNITVMDSDETPVDEAEVWIYDEAGGELLEGAKLTDQDGIATFTLERGNFYHAEAEKNNSRGGTGFDIDQNQDEPLDFTIFLLDENEQMIYFEVTEGASVSLEVSESWFSIRTGNDEFDETSVQINVQGGPIADVGVWIKALPEPDATQWIVTNNTPAAGEIALKWTVDEDGEDSGIPDFPATDQYISIDAGSPTELFSSIETDAQGQAQESFWIQGLTSTDTPANTRAFIVLTLEADAE